MDLEYLRHEKFDRFKIGDVAAIVKVDYVCKTKEGKIVLCDWKTGIDNVEYESDSRCISERDVYCTMFNDKDCF